MVSATSIYNRGIPVTASDTVNLAPFNYDKKLTSAIVVGVAGVIVGVFQDDSTATMGCAAGVPLPVALKRINSTNTTATGIVALYVN